MPATLGDNTVTTFLKGATGTDIHQEFEVAAGQTVYIGQPIILTAAGLVQGAATDQTLTSIIGTAIQNRLAGELVTVATRFRCITWSLADAIQDAGAIAYAGYVVDNTLAGAAGYNKYAIAGTAAVSIGWGLDAAAAAEDQIRVGLV